MPAPKGAPTRARRLSLWPLAVLAALLAACAPEAARAPASEPAAGGGRRGDGDAATVGLATELPGRLEASRVAQVRARAAGIVQKRLFREGSDVQGGPALFQIDASPYAGGATPARRRRSRARRPT